MSRCNNYISIVPRNLEIGMREYCILDLSLPCVVDGPNAWFFDGVWKWLPSGDPGHNAKVIGKEYFDAVFGELPPLPD